MSSTSCNMWFQRVTEVDEAKDDISESSVVEGTSVELEPPRQLHPKFTGPVLGPADFQRVRMLRKTTAVPLSTSDRSESPQAVSLEEVDTASLISMPSKDAQKFDNKQGSTTRDIDGLSISSPDDDSDNISPEPGCLKHDRPQKIPAEEVNIVSSTSISSEDKLDNGQESMIQDFARLVTAGFKENLHDYNIAPEFGYTKQDHGKSRLGHRHHGGQGHGSTSHRTRAPEYHWEWFWACVRAPIPGLSVHTNKVQCYCAKHAAMSTSINVACPGCQHIRCDYCPVESVKIRAPEFNNFQTNSHRAIF
jgi:hypothetical protein